MKKNILIACAAFLCAAGVFAAGKDRVELKVWESQGPESEFIQYAIKAYRKVNPKVKIRYESVSVTDSRAKIELDGPAGVGADVFVAPHDTLGGLFREDTYFQWMTPRNIFQTSSTWRKLARHTRELCSAIPWGRKPMRFSTTRIL